MEFTIRKALPEDAHEYAVCAIAAWKSAYKGIVSDEYLESMPHHLIERTENYTHRFKDPNSHFYLSTYEGKPIGTWLLAKARMKISCMPGK